jgi:hypothetical protein
MSNVASGNTFVFEVLCTAGKQPTGGGFRVQGGIMIAPGDVIIYESSPAVTTPNSTGWRIVGANRTSDARTIDGWVICALTR